jgi:GWxTD domain-containing protein
MNKTAGALAILLASPLLSADGLSRKHKTWDRTPEAYFLTRAERAEWKNVRTDPEAQNFILDYKARRGQEWEKRLTERIFQADKYFSAGEVKGSETLRGKIVIMFGPPSDAEYRRGEKREIVERTNVRGSSGGRDPTGYAPPHVQTSTFTLRYDATAAPKAIGKAFQVEVKMISRSHQETWDPKGLDEKFERVAQASILTGSRDSR